MRLFSPFTGARLQRAIERCCHLQAALTHLDALQSAARSGCLISVIITSANELSFSSVCLSDCLFVNLCVCWQDHSNSYLQILIKLGGSVGCGPGKNCFVCIGIHCGDRNFLMISKHCKIVFVFICYITNYFVFNFLKGNTPISTKNRHIYSTIDNQ